VSVLMANKQNCPEPKSQEIAASYQNKGTLKTMKNIVKHRGVTGLYTGFKLHLSKWTGQREGRTGVLTHHSARYPRNGHILYDIRKRQATADDIWW
jgi:hypothetical protein